MTLLSILVHAQNSYFSKMYNLDHGEFSYSILQDGNRFIFATASYSAGGSKIKASLNAIDSSGTFLWSKVIQDSTTNFYIGSMGSLIATSDGGFAIGGTTTDSIDSGRGALYKFDSSGDTMWVSLFGDTSYQKFDQVKQTQDGGYILIGATTSYDIYGDVWLVKTDSLGSMQWEKHFGQVNIFDVGVSVVQTTDGGYFIGGERYFFSTENGDWLMIKTDSLGNMQWERLYGGPYEESCYSVLQASDGSLVGGGFYTVYCLGLHNGSPFCQPNIIKIDTVGNLISNKKYGPVKFLTGLVSICETPDGGIVGAGSYYEDDSLLFQSKGMVVKANAQGDSLWYRNYTMLNPHSDNVLYDIRTTSDSGFIVSGVLFPTLPDTGYIDTWLLKLDSLGCDTADCWLNVGMNESFEVEKRLIIYPNPSFGIFSILVDEPVKKIEVFNFTGEQILFDKTNTNEINLRQATSGVYFYRITTGSDKVYHGRLVKL